MAMSWPEAIFYLGVLVLVTFLISLFIVGTFDARKNRLQADQAEDLRQRSWTRLTRRHPGGIMTADAEISGPG
ncbi:hypothetical protein ETD86_00145 [Nonomuraea turkmeniaca]|uniref:Uncharacterized protein n=1 Tax=Nonomuraea turkmeniaca TaxID=103838 RepID=A0A5S4FXT5_9ACTN|nr:hypothetical protein [Nonomuraea turkmeniaca]TMR25585.1 hypothetical protein ETD86_00145 [Nonomuraea turkmeniaca]